MNALSWILLGLWIVTVVVVVAVKSRHDNINGRLAKDMLYGSVAAYIRSLLKHLDSGNNVEGDIKKLCNEVTYYIALGGTVMALNWCVEVTTSDMSGLKNVAKIIGFDWYLPGDEISIFIGGDGQGVTYVFDIDRANSLVMLTRK